MLFFVLIFFGVMSTVHAGKRARVDTHDDTTNVPIVSTVADAFLWPFHAFAEVGEQMPLLRDQLHDMLVFGPSMNSLFK